LACEEFGARMNALTPHQAQEPGMHKRKPLT
jgi:hypothetical protein